VHDLKPLVNYNTLEEYEVALRAYIDFFFQNTDGQLLPTARENGVTPRVVFKSVMEVADKWGCHNPPTKDQYQGGYNGAIAWLNYLAERRTRAQGISFHDVARLSKLDALTGLIGDGLHCVGRPTCSFQALILLHHSVLTLGRGSR
jgi:hypothetical protein